MLTTANARSVVTLRSTAARSVVAAIRRGEIGTVFTLLHSLDELRLGGTRGYEVELSLVDEVLEVRTWLPLHLHVGDVLGGEGAGILHTLAGEGDVEVAERTQANLLALQKLLTDVVHGDVERGVERP